MPVRGSTHLVESKARGVWGGIHLSQSLQFGSQEPSFPVQVIPVKSQELWGYVLFPSQLQGDSQGVLSEYSGSFRSGR